MKKILIIAVSLIAFACHQGHDDSPKPVQTPVDTTRKSTVTAPKDTYILQVSVYSDAKNFILVVDGDTSWSLPNYNQPPAAGFILSYQPITKDSKIQYISDGNAGLAVRQYKGKKAGGNEGDLLIDFGKPASSTSTELDLSSLPK